MKRWRHYTKETAIVLAAFGSVQALENYKNFYALIKEKFSPHDIFLCFSSRTVLKKLAAQKKFMQNLPQTLANLDREGYKKIIIISLNLFPTDEQEELEKIVQGFSSFSLTKFFSTPALFSRTKIFSNFLFQLHNSLRQKNPHANFLYVAHGSPHLHQAGTYALEYARNFLTALDECADFFTIEGVYPISLLLARYTKKLQKNISQKIVLVPMLLVSGTHFAEDIISIKHELEINFSVSLAAPFDGEKNFFLLQHPLVQEIIINEIKIGLEKNNCL